MLAKAKGPTSIRKGKELVGRSIEVNLSKYLIYPLAN